VSPGCDYEQLAQSCYLFFCRIRTVHHTITSITSAVVIRVDNSTGALKRDQTNDTEAYTIERLA